jgi:hypothetical protein
MTNLKFLKNFLVSVVIPTLHMVCENILAFLRTDRKTKRISSLCKHGATEKYLASVLMTFLWGRQAL